MVCVCVTNHFRSIICPDHHCRHHIVIRNLKIFLLFSHFYSGGTDFSLFLLLYVPIISTIIQIIDTIWIHFYWLLRENFPGCKKKMKDDHHYTQTTTVILTLFLAKKNTPFKNESIMSFSTHPKPIQFINSKFLSMTDIVCVKEIFDATNDSGLLLSSSSFISVEAKKKSSINYFCAFSLFIIIIIIMFQESKKIFFRWHRETKKNLNNSYDRRLSLSIHLFIS